jgi:glyoxylase-like metal-dependent hydrolase (beta-lactamase superfamily II)
MFEPLYDRIKTAIGEISDLPVRYLVNTHHHRDHIEGNARFAEDGAEIISQENMVPLVAGGSVSGLTDARVPPAPPAAIPRLVFADEMDIKMPGLTAELRYPGPSHTNADTYIVFPEQNVIVAGDIVTFGRYPNIDFVYEGHIQLMIDVTDRFIAMADDDTVIVPGHGPLGDKETLIGYREMLATSRDRVADLMVTGMPLTDIIAARPNADYDAAMNVDERRIENWIRVIYFSYNPPG